MMHIRPTEFLLLVMAVVLMLEGAALMLADMVSPGIAIPPIAVGIALRSSRRAGGGVSTPVLMKQACDLVPLLGGSRVIPEHWRIRVCVLRPVLDAHT